MSNVPLVTKFKAVKEETQTFFNWNDLAQPIIDTMGFDMWDTIQILKDRELENVSESGPSIIDYIEDGVFSEQVKESGVIQKLIESILIDLDDQGYLKKNKNIKNFIPDEEVLFEHIDQKLSPGMMKYFGGD